MPRKRPIRHSVRSYSKKSGSRVRDYERGSGTRTERPRKVVGKAVGGRVLGDLKKLELVLSKDQETAWWKDGGGNIVYWMKDWVPVSFVQGMDVDPEAAKMVEEGGRWMWKGPYILEGYESESMDGRSLGIVQNTDDIEMKLVKYE